MIFYNFFYELNCSRILNIVLNLFLGLTTLKNRRIRGDLIEMHNVISRRESIEWMKFLKSKEKRRYIRTVWKQSKHAMGKQSFSSRIRKSFCSRATIRDNFFVNRIVQIWNSLPNTIVTSPSLNLFKSSIDVNFKRFGCYSF